MRALLLVLALLISPLAGAQYDPVYQQRMVELQQISWRLQQLQQQLQQLYTVPQYMGRPLTQQEAFYVQQIQQEMTILQNRAACLQSGRC
jgi:hypothetical protein